jgi:TIR domain
MDYISILVIVFGALLALLALLRMLLRHLLQRVGTPQRPAPTTEASERLKEPIIMSHTKLGAGRQLDRVRFHTLWPRCVRPQEWHTLFVYLFSGERGLSGARADFRQRMRAPVEQYLATAATARRRVRYGTQISILLELSGFRFNPPTSTILWLEDWHCVEFRMQSLLDAVSTNEDRIEGRVSFYVGPLLIAENELYVEIRDDVTVAGQGSIGERGERSHEASLAEDGASVYRVIFVSYSHKDSYIVDQLQKAYRALGDDYFRDVEVLRSGEVWSEALLAKIRDANIFQLCWSSAAQQSKYVGQEWQYAPSLQRQRFIRPMYWQKPMPVPPAELSQLHFTYIEMEGR